MENMIVYSQYLCTCHFFLDCSNTSYLRFDLTNSCVVSPVNHVDTDIWVGLLSGFPTKYGELSLERAKSIMGWKMLLRTSEFITQVLTSSITLYDIDVKAT